MAGWGRGDRNAYGGLVAKIKGKRSLRRTECRWTNDFKIGFIEVLISP